MERITNRIAPAFKGKSYTLTADVQIPAGGADGVIIAQGGRNGGFTLYVQDHHVVYEVNAFGNRSGRLVSAEPIDSGKAHIVVAVQREGESQEANGTSFAVRKARGGSATLAINGKPQGSAQFSNLNGSSNETLDVGSDLGSPVSPDYKSPAGSPERLRKSQSI